MSIVEYQDLINLCISKSPIASIFIAISYILGTYFKEKTIRLNNENSHQQKMKVLNIFERNSGFQNSVRMSDINLKPSVSPETNDLDFIFEKDPLATLRSNLNSPIRAFSTAAESRGIPAALKICFILLCWAGGQHGWLELYLRICVIGLLRRQTRA